MPEKFQNQKPILEYIPDFLEYLAVEKNLSNNSQITYHYLLSKFEKWLKNNHLEKITPSELTKEHIWKYRLFLSKEEKNNSLKEPLKRSTQNYYLIALRNLLKFFVEREIQSLVPESIKLGKEKKEKTIKFLTLDQLKKLLSAPKQDTKTGLRDRAILETLFSTGMRVAELVSLNRDQIKIKPETKDLEISIIGKGSRERTVYFSERAINAIRDYLKIREDQEPALFVNFKGPKETILKRLTTRSVQNIVKKYSKIAAIPINATPHVLRHTFATDLLMQGVDLRTVQEFLGHKNISTTQVYTHITNKRLKEIHKKYHSLSQ